MSITIGIVALLGLSLASGQTSLDFTAFETEDVSNVSDLDYIDIDALIVSVDGGVTVGIYNNSIIGDPGITPTRPTITKIFFDDRTGVLGKSSGASSSSGGVSFVSKDGTSLSGGKSIDFQVDTAFTAVSPPSQNGLDPSEFVVFLFTNTSYESLVANINSGDFRIGLYVKEIGAWGKDSAAYVNVIPEPTSAALGLLGSLLLLRRRR